MKESGSIQAGVAVEASTGGSTTVGTVTAGGSVEASAQTGVFVEGSVKANKSGLEASGSFADGTTASVGGSAFATDSKTGFGAGASGSVTVKDGAFAEASVKAGTGGVAASGDASIGTSVGVDGSVTGSNRYVSQTAGGGVSIGEQLAIGGGGEATYSKGVVTVGVSGDVAALVGLDVDVAASVNVGVIVSDAVVVGKAVAGAGKAVENVAANATKDAGNAVKNAGKKAGKDIKKKLHL
jgi:hypothetical protein